MKQTTITRIIVYVCLFVLAVCFFLLLILKHKNYLHLESNRIFVTIGVITASMSLTILLLVFFSFPFSKRKSKNGVFDLFIGEQGTYSLSRFQAVIWAVIIISYQVGTMISLCINNNGFMFSRYQLVFSESSVWLLGLSLSSYIVVKGITVNQINRTPKLYKRKISAPEWSDLVIGDNGLDFSRCQILIWTIIAIIIYESKCYYFLTEIRTGNLTQISRMFSDSNQYNENSSNGVTLGLIPYLPWTFIVLMGLSQGAYVSKKLVPTFKLDDIKANKQEQLADAMNQLKRKQDALSKNIEDTKINCKTPLDSLNLKNLHDEVADLKTKISQINIDITEINNIQKTN